MELDRFGVLAKYSIECPIKYALFLLWKSTQNLRWFLSNLVNSVSLSSSKNANENNKKNKQTKNTKTR